MDAGTLAQGIETLLFDRNFGLIESYEGRRIVANDRATHYLRTVVTDHLEAYGVDVSDEVLEKALDLATQNHNRLVHAENTADQLAGAVPTTPYIQ